MRNTMNWKCEVCKCVPKDIIVVGVIHSRLLCRKCFKAGK